MKEREQSPFFHATPKAELHVHLEGTAPPELIGRIARRNGIVLPAGLLREDDTFAWTDFLDFLKTYDTAASVIRTAEDYRDITYEYLTQCADEGAIYVELIASPDHAAFAGLPDAEHFAGIAQGIDDARAASGIEARIVVTCLRHLGHERAEQLAQETVADRHPYVVGFNIAGDEAGFPPAPFTRAFAIAHEAGLGCTAHAGEHAGADSIRGALALPGVTRIGHGVRAIEDPELVAELADRGTVLEVCPTSNVATYVFPDYQSHPLPALRRAGVSVTINSDDPPYFATTLGNEYRVANEHLGCDEDTLREITKTAVDAAFAEPDCKKRLHERL